MKQRCDLYEMISIVVGNVSRVSGKKIGCIEIDFMIWTEFIVSFVIAFSLFLQKICRINMTMILIWERIIFIECNSQDARERIISTISWTLTFIRQLTQTKCLNYRLIYLYFNRNCLMVTLPGAHIQRLLQHSTNSNWPTYLFH